VADAAVTSSPIFGGGHAPRPKIELRAAPRPPVDDDGDVRDVLTLLLVSHGAAVRAVASVAEALDAIHMSSPDVLLADIGLPDEDGYSLIRKIRAHERERNAAPLRAIAVSAYATLADREQASAAGYDGHVPKPIDADVLALAIAKVVALENA